MEENLMNANHGQTTKIKTHHARIVVDGTAEKPYYSIEWYDPAKKVYYLGYSSYYIENVFNWLSEYFEIVEAPKTNADRIREWNDHELAEAIANFVSEIDSGDVGYSDDPNDWLEFLRQPAEGE